MRRVLLAIVCTAAGLALLLTFKTHASTGLASSATLTPAKQETPATPAATAKAKSGAGSSGSGSSGSGSSGSGSSGSSAARTVTGDVAQTIYGPIEVTITVKSGKITAVTVPEYPNGTFRDQQINAFAIPQLVQETVAASSAQIDQVSGATYTSQGYIQSLQSAIDKAGL